MKKQFIALVSSCIMILSAGCSNADDTVEKELRHIFVSRNITETGMIYNIDNNTYFVDYETLKPFPLCAVPNCSHNTAGCLSKKTGRIPVLHNDNIYYFNSSEEVVETPDEIKLKINAKLYRTSLDSSEADVICEFEGCSPDTANRYALYGNTLYFIGSDLAPETDEAGGIMYGITGSRLFLCSIDLDSGEYKNHGLIFDDSSYPGAKYTSSANIKLVYNNRIYIKYSFMEEIPEDVCTDEDYTILMFEFDPEEEKMSQSSLPEARYDGEGYYVYNENGSAVVLTEENEKITIEGCEAGINSRIVNNKLFLYGDLSAVADLKTGKIIKPEKYSDHTIIDYTQGNDIVQTPKMTFIKIGEDEFFQ